MKLKKPINQNYCATVVEIKNIIKLDNCDNVVHTNIMGNLVITSKDTKIGDVGLYFPVETQLSKEYCRVNNLYRHSENNSDPDKKGYMEDNRRIRCVKFRGHESQGLFMPISSVSEFLDEGDELFIGDEFDTLNDHSICNKYVVKIRESNPSNKKVKKPKESKIIDNQFRFHEDTNMLYKNLDKFNPEDYIHISYKLHGTSGISSKVLCKKKLSLWNKIGKLLGFNIVNTQYDYIYASRKVIKNSDLNPNASHFYEDDIWGLAHDIVKDYLTNGLTLYYEIVGYLPSGASIQKDYDYGQEPNTFGIYIYRITYTNTEGKVFEYSTKQVQEWCKLNGLKAVPELYYGKAKEFIQDGRLSLDTWRSRLLDKVKELYNDKNCYMCKNIVPEEGAVVRLDKLNFEAYKAKSARFYERETKMLDKGEVDIEENN